MKSKIIYITFFLPFSILAQIGGQTAFSFVDVVLSPRIEAMGGSAIAIMDNDVTLAQSTPSLLNPAMDNELAFLFADYFSDINVLGFSYAKQLKGIGMFSASVKAINYGDLEHNDEVGNNVGSFSAHDQVITLGFGKPLNEKITLGINVNLLNSQYDIYHAVAIASNVSASYYHAEKQFTSTLLFKNIGRQLISYTDEKEFLPLDVQFGLSKELKHLPFRYSLTFHHLNQFDI